MRSFLVLAAVVVGCYCSTLEIVSAPSSIQFPASGADLRSTQLSPLNANLLGLTSRPVDGFDVKTDLFSRPRALAVIRVDAVNKLSDTPNSYPIVVDGFDTLGMDQDLSMVFGSDRENVQITAGGITGSELANSAQSQKVDTSMIKTKFVQLKKELEAVYQLAAAINAKGVRLENTIDVFRVTIGGLAAETSMSEEARNIAVSDIKAAVAKLTSALNTVYGNQALVEVVAVSAFVQQPEQEPAMEDVHHIVKRAVEPTNDNDKSLRDARKSFQVYQFTSGDYPAIFAIFLGLILALVFGLIYIVVGMLSMDPGKDSIIYRMTTTRMKKD